MDGFVNWMIAATLILAAGALGALVHALYLKKQAQARRRIPRQWPLVVRPLVNSREELAWHWLMRSFYDHQVLIKLPVTRFTLPQVQQESQHWFQLLNGVYCTFTVCTIEGRVIGCVDVPGPRGLSLSNQTLKHKLLSQCNIRYCVVDPQRLPTITEIRTALLGEEAVVREEIERMRNETAFKETRENLKALLSRKRHQGQSVDLSNLVPGQDPHHLEAYDSHHSSGWRQHDSFIAPLDSRRGDLR